MKEPNFFIIGAPKCGTTSLARWLGQHPNVFISNPKEPHYFSPDYSLQACPEKYEYYRLFKDANPHHKAIGEASIWYLNSTGAIPSIEVEHPLSKYIVMVRNPVEMAPSLHWQAFYTGDESIENFEAAWSIQDERECGTSIPPRCRDPKLLQYQNACLLGKQLEHLYMTVPRERVLVIFLEDITADVRHEWARVLNFLNVPYWDNLEFYPANRSKHWRWPWVRNLMHLYKNARNRLGLPPLGWGIFERLQRAAVQQADREPISESLRHELIDTFSKDIDRLGGLTGRDLSHWKNLS